MWEESSLLEYNCEQHLTFIKTFSRNHVKINGERPFELGLQFAAI